MNHPKVVGEVYTVENDTGPTDAVTSALTIYRGSMDPGGTTSGYHAVRRPPTATFRGRWMLIRWKVL